MRDPRRHYPLCGYCGSHWHESASCPVKDDRLARVLFERAQDGYVNPTGGKTTGRERKDT